MLKKEINNAGEPLEYVKGFTEFLECRIDLSQKPLIPRQETEFWVERAVCAVLADKRGGIRCLDVFSGSGCIAVAVLAKTGILLCDIADSQKNCLKQAKINCQLNNIVKSRYKIIKSDVFSNIKGKYDYIFANPPYVATKKRHLIQRSVLRYEPKSALFGGEKGLFYIKKFLAGVKKHLKPGGRIFMEFSPEQKTAIAKLGKNYGYANCEFYRDQFDRWRWAEIT